MKKIEKLISIAREKSELQFELGLVLLTSSGKWEARGHLWNHIPHKNPKSKIKNVSYICDSMEEAVTRLEELREKYPNSRTSPIIVEGILED